MEKSCIFVETIKNKNKMKNTDYIKKNYKLSTIARLKDFGYDTLKSINIDPDMTYALKVCKNTSKENQDSLFSIINDIKNKNKMETPKQIIVSSENTDVWALAQILNEEQVAALLSSLLIQGKIKDYER